MFKPTEEKSIHTKEAIDKIFQITNPNEGFTVVYGYNVKQNVFKRRIYRYIIGFNEQTSDMTIIVLTRDGEIVRTAHLKKSDIKSARFVYENKVMIRTSHGKLNVIVPPYTPTTLESLGIMPIVQEENEKQFRTFLKTFM